MKTRAALALVALVAAGASCTAFVAANLSGTNGNVVKSLGGCFNLTDNSCGECIANNCENPNGSPPVSLAKVCSLNQYSSLALNTGECVQNPTPESYQCGNVFVDGGSYASSIDTSSAAENNAAKCITDNCFTSCNWCAPQVPTCESDTVPLLEAGACGVCLHNAMNLPNSPCQQYVLAGGCGTGAIGACATPTGSCGAFDCSGLSAPDTNLEDAGYGLVSCLWGECQGQCPNPTQ
jgi:hypothetical protein